MRKLFSAREWFCFGLVIALMLSLGLGIMVIDAYLKMPVLRVILEDGKEGDTIVLSRLDRADGEERQQTGIDSNKQATFRVMAGSSWKVSRKSGGQETYIVTYTVGKSMEGYDHVIIEGHDGSITVSVSKRDG
ncbi:MAG: hypothetical protein A3H69_00135 [Candidatus Sungbacteria bacterium RIFCSPLOWO2_02_FULL_47_9]|uniref:Uncharacterized protein n=1 Tax=Candidatus Sungbacteria bacterium RIFCSPHIGHO2_01_FULL_47_32 TaxID=1802264 RepID=A0A1G2K4S6_9BACT|nr:MAG: hypothetical protein UX72_C0001G0097 [Parcubacteria group bacterium GW2011_GWA2_47_10]OGZ94417.1 MAG: hypothetical protein A2633_04020 [Candidatus Sungbacteria bacterium RIFCSPHIGHO2_01_FULL_47_32]OGZ98009.1 MAG: hypothetical protein A3D57_02725 [Candidatus Sungbacteria bacterium RIFCSPHIGHO2_02_FULL_46_12]OHA05759.1 MAG: hypothetical protein A3A28_05485 [Candidatus Sungbacteria bacterium RIFCSPLOWO2_01_FULL_47_32]OHA12178.1 MAG: hypothetical protein A3H69_00135 [Candidatus Sungbacteria